jgi:DNA-binding response OmpR family regulator
MAKILVIDDDRDMTEACQLVLEQAGHEVQVAYSAEEGMAKVASFRPKLLVLDIMMVQPDDGIAMAQELRRTGFDAPILMLTSISKVTGMKYDKNNVMIPVNEFVEKPVPPATLVELVARLLSGKEAD